MPWPKCNATLENARSKRSDCSAFTSPTTIVNCVSAVPEDFPVVVGNLTTHHLLIVLAASGTGLAIVLFQIQVILHTTHYCKPWEQRHIIRILFMVPVYSVSNLLTVIYYTHAVYFELLGNTYAAIGLASFFALMTHYLAPNLHEQKIYYRRLVPRNWVWPVSYLQKTFGGKTRGPFRIPKSGLTWFNVLWCGVYQYCFVLISMSLVGVITHPFGLYCQESLNPAFSHVWLLCINSISAVIAAFCIRQLHAQINSDLREHKTSLKKFCIDAVLFLSVYQTLLIALLVAKWPGGTSAIKPSQYISSPDLRICLSSTILCLEMAVIATLHLWAYDWKPYHISSEQYAREAVPGERNLRYVGGIFGLRATVDALNIWDLVKAIGRSARWAVKGRKTRFLDESYASHSGSEIGLDQSGQKLSNISTGYSSRPNPGASNGHGPVNLAEGQGLLVSAELMPISRPGLMEQSDVSLYGRRADISPERDPFPADIGIAISSYDEMAEWERLEELQPSPAYQSPYQAYVSDDRPVGTRHSRTGSIDIRTVMHDGFF